MTNHGSPPNSAERTSSRHQIVGRMSGAPPVVLAKSPRRTASRLLRELGPECPRALVALGLTAATVGMTVLGPRLLGWMTDTVVQGVIAGRVDFDELRRLGAIGVSVYISAALCGWLQATVLAGIVQRTLMRFRTQIEDKVHRLPLGYVDRTPRGELLSRATNDVDNISQSVQTSLSQMLTALLMVVGIAVMMVTVSAVVALVALALVPLSAATAGLVGSRSRKRFSSQWTYTGHLNAQVEEVFTGHNLVKVFGHVEGAEAAFDECNQHLGNASFRAQLLVGIMQPMMMFLGNLNYLGVAILGALRVASGSMSIGSVQALLQYSRQFSQPLTQLAGMMNMVQSGLASAERIFDLLDAPEESPDAHSEPTVARGRVEFSDVFFSYQPDTPLIQGLSLVAEPGQTVALVGPTGAGKTTVVNLLMRFADIDSGTITLDGVDISTMSRAALRSNIGMVLQDTWLFEGTIRDNIAYGRIGATDDEVHDAARLAYVDRFVHSLPSGYDTMIDEDGSNLSTGEKQLLTIARAFLADPTILILDEATSSVDTRTELLIQHAMATLRSRRTSFVIAHRLSTIRDADEILMMSNGRIVERGTHQQLLAKGGAYFGLFDSQFRAPAIDIDEVAPPAPGASRLPRHEGTNGRPRP